MGRSLAEIQNAWKQDQDTTEWRPIPGYPIYEMDEKGHVRVAQSKWQISPARLDDGWVYVLAYNENGGYGNAYDKVLRADIIKATWPEGLKIRGT